MNSLICSAPGRICLFGDHMDWCSRQVITAAVDMRIFLEGHRENTHNVEVHSFPLFSTQDTFPLSSIDLDTNTDLRYARGVISAMKRTTPYTLKGMNLRFHPADTISKITGENRTYSDLPASKGLSSSAAMSVTVAAVTHILHIYPNLHDNRIKDHIKSPEFQKKCAQTAYQGERIELGINCGQMDPYASALGGILHIDCSHEPPNIEKYTPEKEMTLIIGDTNQPKDTPRILAWLGKRFQQREETFMEGVTNITEIVREARQELSKRNPSLEKLGTLMNQNQHYIRNNLKISGDCPIAPSNLDTLIQAALKAGAYGAKVTGSGGGGCMIALCHPHSSHPITKNIEAAGGSAITTDISKQGIRLEAIRG